MSEQFAAQKRKERNSSNNSQEQEEGNVWKRFKEVFSPKSSSNTTSLDSPREADTEPSDDEVFTVLEMAGEFGEKLDFICEKIKKLDSIETQISGIKETLGELKLRVTKTESELVLLGTKVTSVGKTNSDLEEAQNYVNKELEDLKKGLRDTTNDLQEQIFRHEVYVRRENLRFYKIPEEEGENTAEVLRRFLEMEMSVEEVGEIEFQRIHRVGRRTARAAGERPIIARFLRFTDRERVMAKRASLNDIDASVGPDLPKRVVDMRRPLVPKMLKARKEGKKAAFSLPEPWKLIIDGEVYEG